MQDIFFLEKWEWINGNEQGVVATIKEKKSGLLRQWQIEGRGIRC